MKKLILFGLAIFLCIPNISAAKPWWAIGIVDAAGALGGAGSVLGSTGGIAATNPVGWAAAAGGAILGGAGASIAYNGLVVQDDPTTPGDKFDVVRQTAKLDKAKKGAELKAVKATAKLDKRAVERKFDYVGKNHNLLVSGFLKTGVKYSDEAYWEFVQKNGHKYGVDNNKYYTLDDLKKQTEIIKTLKSDDDIVKFATQALPDDIDKKAFVKFLYSFSEDSDLSTVQSKIKKYEQSIQKDKKVSQPSKDFLEFFLSTLENSTILWYR